MRRYDQYSDNDHYADGYKRPEYLAKIGRIQAAEWTIDMLEDAIEQQTPYISDYF